MVTLNNQHFEALRRFKDDKYLWGGQPPATWAASLGITRSSRLCALKLNRTELIRISCPTSDLTDGEVFLSVMAWGGMRRDHARDAWQEREKWLPIIKALRNEKCARRDAYRAFQKAEISGLGPAYFTKLIFFSSPHHSGYIMDQWTGKSINLLFGDGKSHPILFSGHWVSRSNSPETYEEFCVLVEHLAKKLEVGPPKAEEMMFSSGGKNPGRWRQYVKLNWRQTA